MLKSVFSEFFHGVVDSFQVFRIFDILNKSENLRMKLLYCFGLNGILFLGSILIYNTVINPLVNAFGVWISLEHIEIFSLYFFYVTWIVPMFLICNIISTFWIDEIYNETLELVEETSCIKVEGQDLITALSNQLERLFIVVLMLVQIKVLSLSQNLVFVVLKYCSMCILNSLYVFEYILLQKYIRNYKSIMRFIETKFFYFLGFGVLLTCIISYIDSFVYNSAIFLMAFPLLLIASIKVNDKSFQNIEIRNGNLYFFRLISLCYDHIIKMFMGSKNQSHQKTN